MKWNIVKNLLCSAFSTIEWLDDYDWFLRYAKGRCYVLYQVKWSDVLSSQGTHNLFRACHCLFGPWWVKLEREWSVTYSVHLSSFFLNLSFYPMSKSWIYFVNSTASAHTKCELDGVDENLSSHLDWLSDLENLEHRYVLLLLLFFFLNYYCQQPSFFAIPHPPLCMVT